MANYIYITGKKGSEWPEEFETPYLQIYETSAF